MKNINTKNRTEEGQANIQKPSSVPQEQLYNLLFAGRISLKEYLEQVRKGTA